MGTELTKEAYKKLIDEDVAYLNEKLCVEDYSAELKHIKLVLFKSIDLLYPPRILDIITPSSDKPQTLEESYMQYVKESKSDECKGCGSKNILIREFGYCGSCARLLFE